jgi:uncharacterized protein Yka (UPF0111/DUF47 family)
MLANLMCILKKFFELLIESDHGIRAGLHRLFAKDTDARILIRSIKLYDMFEYVFDSYQDIADDVHDLMLERI